MELKKMRFNKKGPQAILSPIESEIIQVLWKQEHPLKTRQIYTHLRRKKIPLTSIAVNLDRLHKKKLVRRTAEQGLGGFHYLYSSRGSKEEFEKTLVEHVVDKLIDSFGHSAVTYFNERFSKKRRSS